MRYVAAVTAILLLMAVGAQATTITATFKGVDPGLGVTVTGGGATGVGTTAGVYKFDVGSNPPLNIPSGINKAFCIDLTQNVSTGGTYTWEVVAPTSAPVPYPGGGFMSATQADELGKLFTLYYMGATGTNNTESAAFQAAVWEIVFETGAPTDSNPDLRTLEVDGAKDGTHGNPNTRGSCYVNAGWAATARADQMLAGVLAYDYEGPYSSLYAWVAPLDQTTGKVQDQLILMPNGYIPPIPEPLTMAGLGLGLCGLVGYIRKRRG